MAKPQARVQSMCQYLGFETELNPTYFVINYSKLFYRHPPNLLPPRVCPGYPWLCRGSVAIDLERETSMSYVNTSDDSGRQKGHALPLRKHPLKKKSSRPVDHLSPRLETMSPPTPGHFTLNRQNFLSIAPPTS